MSSDQKDFVITGGTCQFIFILATTLVAVGFLSFFQATSHDVGFHLATGRLVVNSGQIPSTNELSFAMPNQRWLLHQWAPAVVMSLIYDAFGFHGLIVLRVLVVLATFSAVFAAARLTGAHPLMIAIFTVLGAAAAATRFLLRPFLFTHLLLALLLLVLFSWWRKPRTWLLAVAAALAAVSLNMHAGGLYLFITLGLFCAVYAAPLWICPAIDGIPRLHSSTQLFRLIAFSFGAAIIGVVAILLTNPSGIEALLLPIRYSTDPFWNAVILEFAPIPLLQWSKHPFFWAMACLTLLGLVLTWRRRTLLFWLLFACGFALALKHQRLVYLSALLFIPVASTCWTTLLSHRLTQTKPLLTTLTSVAVLALIASQAAIHNAGTQRFGFGAHPGMWPHDAFEFIDKMHIAGRVFTSDRFSGAFLGQFFPQKKVFYDNRLEAYSKQFVQQTYQVIASGTPGWRELVDRYHIDVFLIDYAGQGRTHAVGHTRFLSDRLAADPAFTLVYFDDYALVWIRDTPRNHPIIERFGYSRINPDRFWVGEGAPVAALEHDLQQRIRRQPQCLKAYWYLGGLLLEASRTQEAVGILQRGLTHFPDSSALSATLREAQHNK